MNVWIVTDDPQPDFHTREGEWVDWEGKPVPAGCPVEVRPAEAGHPEWYEALVPETAYGGEYEWVEITRKKDR